MRPKLGSIVASRRFSTSCFTRFRHLAVRFFDHNTNGAPIGAPFAFRVYLSS